MVTAVCVRCGSLRQGFDQICPKCGFRPDGEGLLVAWLLSSANLPKDELDRVAARVAAGESIRPSARQVDKARKALGQHFSSDPGLTTRQRMALLGCSLLVTPLVGLMLAGWWRAERPRAAFQSLALSLPASILWFAAVLWAGSR